MAEASNTYILDSPVITSRIMAKDLCLGAGWKGKHRTPMAPVASESSVED